ncbi:MAG: DUF1080 domain-containing protein [Deltaproteobacteria bacterium]|nr:DUF1080 domain-containing protein [Deltaproteobacteria bacterium]
MKWIISDPPYRVPDDPERSTSMIKGLIGIFGILLLATSGLAQSGPKSWNFDSETAGKPPSGFTTMAGEWKVVADPTAPSQPKALAQLAKSSGSTFNLILIAGTSYKDIDLTVSMKSVAGTEDQGGGLVWRAKDGKNYYVARYNPLEDNYNLYKVKNGNRSKLGSATIKSAPGWHALRVTMRGNRIEVYFDRKKVLDAEDATFTEPGGIGLWTKSDAQTHFYGLTVGGD